MAQSRAPQGGTSEARSCVPQGTNLTLYQPAEHAAALPKLLSGCRTLRREPAGLRLASFFPPRALAGSQAEASPQRHATARYNARRRAMSTLATCRYRAAACFACRACRLHPCSSTAVAYYRPYRGVPDQSATPWGMRGAAAAAAGALNNNRPWLPARPPPFRQPTAACTPGAAPWRPWLQTARAWSLPRPPRSPPPPPARRRPPCARIRQAGGQGGGSCGNANGGSRLLRRPTRPPLSAHLIALLVILLIALLVVLILVLLVVLALVASKQGQAQGCLGLARALLAAPLPSSARREPHPYP